MVWFQCEVCGDNLKKPKLPSHFRQCSAYKLSCIDCGQVFGQQEVESHTQCITEAEKYGPKGQGKASNGSNTKPKNDAKQKPEVDINVGLSERPPWFCILCNTKATSKQTLLLHADGKKHRAKARAIHAKQQASDAAETKVTSENDTENKIPRTEGLEESGNQNSPKVSRENDDSTVENNASELNKKRKLEACENGDISAEVGNSKYIQIKEADTELIKGLKKAKHSATQELAKLGSAEDVGKMKIKWKKLITSALKSNSDGALKLKKLTKHAVKSLKESGYTNDKARVSEVIEQKMSEVLFALFYFPIVVVDRVLCLKHQLLSNFYDLFSKVHFMFMQINSSSRFIVDGKYVRLASTSS